MFDGHHQPIPTQERAWVGRTNHRQPVAYPIHHQVGLFDYYYTGNKSLLKYHKHIVNKKTQNDHVDNSIRTITMKTCKAPASTKKALAHETKERDK